MQDTMTTHRQLAGDYLDETRVLNSYTTYDTISMVIAYG